MSVQRSVLLGLSRQPWMKRLVMANPLTKKVIHRFVPGETLPDVLGAARRLVADGLMVTIDVLGEDTTSVPQARQATHTYIELLEALGREGLAESVEVSLKLSAVGQALVDGESTALEHAGRICATAAEVGTTVTLDMEDHTTTDSTLRVLRQLREQYPTLGCVLQAYLHRTVEDARALSGEGSRVRLCKGAYDEPDTVAHRDAADVDTAYVQALAVLMAGDGYPMVASHDPRIIDIASDMAIRTDRSEADYEYQMLYGVRPQAQLDLVRRGHRVRVYVPFGPDWYGYFMRRLAERPANLLFMLRSLISTR